MPTYEYECIDCGHKFDLFQKINDQPIKTCPKCRKEVKRLIGKGSGIIFRGSGFYATDYRRTDKAEQKSKIPPGSCPKIKEGCKECS